MNTKLRTLILTLFIALALSFTLTASTGAKAERTPDTRTLLASLPTSDVVIFVDLRRIMTEIVPRLLANDPATLVKMTAAVNEVKTKTGFNILSVESVVCGIQFIGPATHNIQKQDVGIVVMAHGDFDANALIAFIKKETNGKFHEETYGGKVIYSEPPEKKKEREIAALTVLDANTVALGDLPQIRATVDAYSGQSRVDSALVELAERDSSSIVGAAGNVPESLLQDLRDTAPPQDEMAQVINKMVQGIKQIFLSIGATPTDFNVITGARLSSAEQAASISDMLLGLRQQISSQITDEGPRSMIEALQISAQGDEVQIKTDIKNEVVQQFVASMMKNEKPPPKVPDDRFGAPRTQATATQSTSTKTKQTARRRRSKRRRRH